MEKKKHKILKRVMPVLCAVLVMATALITPVGAVINSSQGEFNNYDITGRSTFPLTVGFSYASRDLSTGAGSSYVYSTYVGQYGVEYNQTENGSETYTYKYDAYGDGSTVVDQTGELLYTLEADEWKEAIEVENSGSYRYGKKRISMTNSNFSTGNIAGRQQGVVLRADDIVFNPYSVIDTVRVTVNTLGQEYYEYTYLDDISYSVPCFLTPNTLAYTDNLGIEVTYSWSCDVINANGEKSHHSNTATYDNRTSDYQQEVVPIIDANTLANQIGGNGNGGKLSPTIIIQNYYGYLEYKYYEYVAPQIEFTLNGTTYACPDGMTWGEYADLDTTEYPASTNADVRFLYSTDGTGMQFNNNGTWQFILYNGEYVQDTDTIIGRAVYTLEEVATGDALAGTWLINDTIEVFDDTFYGIYSSTPISSKCFGYYSSDGTIKEKECSLEYGDFYIGVKCVNAWGKPQFEIPDTQNFMAQGFGLAGAKIVIYKVDGVIYNPLLLTWLQANATKQSTASVAVASDEPTTTSTDTTPRTTSGTWNEVERSESAELVLWYPLLDTSGITINESNAYLDWYEYYSFPDMSKYIDTFGVEPPDYTFDFTSWIGTAVGGFLNMELMPYFSIGGVLAIIIGFAVLMMILKWLAGG